MYNLKYGDITGKIIGCAINVHKKMGAGFQEVIYQRALEHEMKKKAYSLHANLPCL